MDKFIKVFSAEVAEKLRMNGFTCLGNEGNVYTFLNNGKLLFSEDDNKHMKFTNILSI